METGFKTFKFADPLKDMLRVLGLTDVEIESHLKEQPAALLLGASPRHAMQTLGTEWGRNLIHEDLWGNIWLDRIRKYLWISKNNKVVCDDIRFPNEEKFLRSAGGTLIRVNRPKAKKTSHSSETEIDKLHADYVIENVGTLDELKQKILGVVGPVPF